MMNDATESGTFHIQNTVKPKYIVPILQQFPRGTYLTANVMHDLLETMSVKISPENVGKCLRYMMQLDLLTRGNNYNYKLTDFGDKLRELSQFRHEVFHDIIHFQFYTRYLLGVGNEYWSWVYMKICEKLWNDRPTIRKRGDLFGEISGEAKAAYPSSHPALGKETIGVVLNWLQELSPIVIQVENNKPKSVLSRDWFSIELAILSCSFLYSKRNIAFGSPLLLIDETISDLCSLCFATSDTVIAMIEVASRSFPFLSLSAGEWGASLVLSSDIDIDEIC